MSKDANNSLAAGATETRNALLVGLLLLLLLILAPLYWVERAQQDLTERSREALRNGGLDADAFEVGFDGRDARLIGSQAQAAQLDQARRLVEGVWGVRTVSTRATAADAGAPAGTAFLTSAPAPSATVLASGPAVPASSDSPPQEPQPTAPKPAPVIAPKSAPQATKVASAEAPPAPQTAARAGAPTPAEPIASEAVSAAPADQPPATLAMTPSGPEQADEIAPAGPATAPAPTERHDAAETAFPGSMLEPAPEPAEASPHAAAVATPAEISGTPPPAAIESTPAPVPQTPATQPSASEPVAVSSPDPEAAAAAIGGDTEARTGELRTDTLLTDWPDLAAVEDLRLEMQQDQVWLRGQVNSLADLQRIEAQFPDSTAARHVRLDLQLAERNTQELADYLNLVSASFRFRTGTSHFGPAGERAMDRIADTLKSYPGMRLGLAGRAPETVKPQVRRVHARHRSGATYRALLKRGVDGQQLFLADFASPFSPMLSQVPVAPSGPGQIQFFSLER